MGFEIPIDSGYPGHRKVADLMARLKDPQGDIWPLRLFFWAVINARDGVIRVSPRTLEVALRWRGRPGLLVRNFKASGWLEPDGKRIHGWMEGIGRAIQLYEAKKDKQRRRYAAKHGLLPEESAAQEEEFRNSSGRIPPIRDIRDNWETRDMKSGGGDAPGSPSALEEGRARVLGFLRAAKVVAASAAQLEEFVDGWIEAAGLDRTLAVAQDARVRGQDIFWIHKAFFERKTGRLDPTETPEQRAARQRAAADAEAAAKAARDREADLDKRAADRLAGMSEPDRAALRKSVEEEQAAALRFSQSDEDRQRLIDYAMRERIKRQLQEAAS